MGAADIEPKRQCAHCSKKARYSGNRLQLLLRYSPFRAPGTNAALWCDIYTADFSVTLMHENDRQLCPPVPAP
jgi:hypothetical protein